MHHCGEKFIGKDKNYSYDVVFRPFKYNENYGQFKNEMASDEERFSFTNDKTKRDRRDADGLNLDESEQRSNT